MKSAYKIVATNFNLILYPLMLLAAILLKFVRKPIVGFLEDRSYISVSRSIFNKVSVFPIIDQYYEPQFRFENTGKEPYPKQWPRLDMNLKEQLALLGMIKSRQELIKLGKLPLSKLTYPFEKGPFLSGDSEYLCALVRLKKPRMITEVDCEHSSLII